MAARVRVAGRTQRASMGLDGVREAARARRASGKGCAVHRADAPRHTTSLDRQLHAIEAYGSSRSRWGDLVRVRVRPRGSSLRI